MVSGNGYYAVGCALHFRSFRAHSAPCSCPRNTLHSWTSLVYFLLVVNVLARYLSTMAGDQLGGGKDAAKSAPPQLQQILPLMLTFLESRSWCHCLGVSHSARDAVRALFAGLMPDGPRPEEGWTGAVYRCFVGDVGDPLNLNSCPLRTVRFGLFVDAHELAWLCISTINSLLRTLFTVTTAPPPAPHPWLVRATWFCFACNSPTRCTDAEDG